MSQTKEKRTPQGKINISILIIGFIVILLFVGVEIYRAVYQNTPSSGVQASSTSITVTTGTKVNSILGLVNIAKNTIIASSVPSATTTPPPVQSTGHAEGLSMGGELPGLSDDQLNQRLNAISALGATWVRFDVEWGYVQYSSPNSYDWSTYDRIVNAINAHHLHALGIITYTPQWARASGCTGGADCPPADPNTFATFANHVAAHYAPFGVHDWEIWNEPNDYDFWATKADCNAYTALLKATYPAIKQSDPTATVITGGLSPQSTDGVNISQIDFLNCIYKDGGKNYFDAVGDHPYTFPQLPSQSTDGAWGIMSETPLNLRTIMIANGDASKKIWLTEFGAPTNGPDKNWYVSEATQAAIVTDALNLYRTYTWVGPIFWYTLVDGGTTTETNENFFGLIRADGSVKPAYTTLQQDIATNS